MNKVAILAQCHVGISSDTLRESLPRNELSKEVGVLRTGRQIATLIAARRGKRLSTCCRA